MTFYALTKFQPTRSFTFISLSQKHIYSPVDSRFTSGNAFDLHICSSINFGGSQNLNHDPPLSMASSSSSSTRNWTYNVFTSFHGPDVRKTFLSHLRRQFNYNGITMFDDQGIERSQTIAPALTQAIRESRISIVVLSKNYASSSWCLDELVEIFKCKEDFGQIVMTVFYGVDPSDVRNQTGDFGKVFKETCARKKKENIQNLWSKALNDVGNIAGEHFVNWDNEAKMIEKIAKDVSEKLHATPSRDFDGMVGLEAHLRKMESFLHLSRNLDATPSMIVGLCGPAGIGKSTIARALHSLHSNKFQLTCFVDNLRESYPGVLNEYSLKLLLQTELLSKILNLSGITIGHLGVLQERLGNQRVLIILDDVKNIAQLEALANEPTWFGPGSRIVITTENKELLQQHGINNTYHVGFPSYKQALEILCNNAFRQSYPRNGFIELAGRVTELCGNLPLGLCVVGSSLRGKNKEEWEGAIRRLDTIFDQKSIEEVLRVGYESLHENEKSLFVHIAVFFNHTYGDIAEAFFAEQNNNLDIKYGLKILANKSLIDVSVFGEIVMHKLLQQVGTNVARREEPWKRKILMDAQDICDVLEDEDDRESKEVTGILFDISRIKKVFINKKAFKRMNKLRFLKVINGNDTLHIPEGMELPRRLRFLHWKAYPGKAFPRTFNLESLVELNMQNNKLEKLWEGALALTNLKKMDLLESLNLKELPDLSNATNLERLNLTHCKSLAELPSSIGNLHKLESLEMNYCRNLQIVPTRLNLASLENVTMMECPKLRKIPEIFTNITRLTIADTMLEELPHRLWSRLEGLAIYGRLDTCQLEKLPDWIKEGLHGLEDLYIYGCPKLASLPELPRSLIRLTVQDCESLETLTSFPFDSPTTILYFANCFQLSEEARRIITDQSFLAFFPGRTMPADLDHRAEGNFLTFRSDLRGFMIWAVVSPKPQMRGGCKLLCRVHVNGWPSDQGIAYQFYALQREHLFISYALISENDRWLEQDNEISIEFSTSSKDIDVIACGVQMLTDDTVGSISSDESDASSSEQDEYKSISDGTDELDEPRVKRLKT